jgi:hypothetical protein
VYTCAASLINHSAHQFSQKPREISAKSGIPATILSCDAEMARPQRRAQLGGHVVQQRREEVHVLGEDGGVLRRTFVRGGVGERAPALDGKHRSMRGALSGVLVGGWQGCAAGVCT